MTVLLQILPLQIEQASLLDEPAWGGRLMILFPRTIYEPHCGKSQQGKSPLPPPVKNSGWPHSLHILVSFLFPFMAGSSEARRCT
jgi:hypothetical protein